MTTLQAVFLGILQGLTEFLPVSSSGHLVIAQSLIPAFTQPGVLFDTVLHAGTLLSVAVYFRSTLLKISKNYLLLLLVGTLPAVVVGLVFRDFLESLFTLVTVVGFALILTAFFDFLTDTNKASKDKINYKTAFFVGLLQSLAIVPGISRSGSTIWAGTKMGVDKKKATEFSFILSIPAILGANGLQIVTNASSVNFDASYIWGFVAAFFSGLVAINLVLKLVAAQKFKLFGVYCFALGLAVLLL